MFGFSFLHLIKAPVLHNVMVSNEQLLDLPDQPQELLLHNLTSKKTTKDDDGPIAR